MKIKRILKEYGMTLGMIWGACFIIFVFTYAMIIKPQQVFKRELAGQIEEKKRDYMAAREISQDVFRKRLLLEVDELESKLRNYVADANGSANLTFDISQIANQNNVASFSIKSRANNNFFEIPQCSLIGENRMDVSFMSDFKQFAVFLNSLERYEPVVFVDSFSVMSGRHSDEGNRVIMGLSVFVEKPLDS
jgi:hypothetical protein